MKKKYVFKVTAFVIIFVLLYNGLNKVMTVSSDARNYQWIGGFYEEPKKSLDAVYIGSSNCYAFWNPVMAWKEYGITVYPYACNTQPFTMAMHLIKETRKTQPDAVFLVNINTLENMNRRTDMFYLFDYMPFSLNKLDLINYMAEYRGLTDEERMEYYFPIIRSHRRWSELKPDDFSFAFNELKGASTYDSYLNMVTDISELYNPADEKVEPSKQLVQYVNELLDYCDTEKIKVVFITVPRVEKEKARGNINYVNEMISSRGYPVLDLTDKWEEIGLDLTKDYYNETHTNIHGSIKYTRYLSQYLIDNYGFEDKRENTEYSSWDEAVEKYEQILAPYVLDIELNQERMTDDLAAPIGLTIVEEGEEIVVSWEPVEGADGYTVYKKTGGSGAWEKAAELTGTRYRNGDCESGKEYFYTIVPFYETDGEKYYGSFQYLGVGLQKS